jgi:type IV pilus assembly protein PilA
LFYQNQRHQNIAVSNILINLREKKMLSRLRKVEGDKGFTWVELLIVIAIISILSAIALPQFGAYKERGYNSDTKASLHNLYLACKAYWAENGAAGTCTAAGVTNATFGYTSSATITIADGTDGSKTGFTATATNSAGGNAAGYGIDSNGTISAL